MRKGSYIINMICFLALLGPASAQKEPDSSGGDGFSRYQLIIDRNPFDPARRPKPAVSEAPPPSPISEAPPSAQRIRLSGVLVTDSKRLAFMEGSGESASQGKEAGQSVQDWTISDIKAGKVILSKDGADLEWSVGSEIQHSGGGDWLQSDGDPADLPEASDEATLSILEKMRARRRSEAN